MKRYEINSSLQSISPAETSLGYSYWNYCLPPFCPETTLILGAGQGTIEKLIRNNWGKDIEIVSVDLNPPAHYIMDASEYVKRDIKYDYVVVDIHDGTGHPDWIFSEEFVSDLARITTKLLSINVLGKAKDMSFYDTYFDFELEKTILDNKIYFYKAKDNKDNYFL